MTRLLVIAALLVAACKGSKGDPGPPCDKVVDHMMGLTKQMMPGHDPESLGDRTALIANCEQRKMSAAMRRCLVNAKTFNDLAICQRNDPKPPAVKPTPEPTRPLPTTPDPGSAAGSGG
jgi:hypothetical protein